MKSENLSIPHSAWVTGAVISKKTKWVTERSIWLHSDTTDPETCRDQNKTQLLSSMYKDKPPDSHVLWWLKFSICVAGNDRISFLLWGYSSSLCKMSHFLLHLPCKLSTHLDLWYWCWEKCRYLFKDHWKFLWTEPCNTRAGWYDLHLFVFQEMCCFK